MAKDERRVTEAPVEHHEEFAYTSQMKWYSSCWNIKMIHVILRGTWEWDKCTGRKVIYV